MSLGDFWLQSNNGKKYSLKDLKDIKPEDVAKNPKFKKLIEIFNWDSDGDGKISVKNTQGKNEWESVFADLQQAAVDNDLTSEEFGLYISQKSQNADLKLEDVNELLDTATISTEETAQANEQSIIDLLTELGVVQPTITDAEINKIKSDAYNTVLTSATKSEKLDKDYEDLHSFAKEKLSKSGKQPTLQEIVLYAAELQLLNPDIKADKKIKKGTSINIPVKSIDKKKLQLLESKGIKVEKDNYIFYQKLLELDDVKQATVLNAINNSKFKTKEEVINDVYDKTRINLADTGLTIKVGSVSSTLENFITNTLKVDLSSKEGLKIYDRLSRLNQAALDSLPKEFVAKLSKMNNITFDKLADKAEVFGIILRTDEEIKEREKNSQEYRDLKARIFMAQYVADNYTSAVTISQSADRNLNFTQGAWWIRNARPIGYTANEEQKRDTAKVNQIKKLIQDVDTLSNEEFSKKMSAIMEAERTVRDIDFSLPGEPSLPSYSKTKDPSFKFDAKLAYTFMKQMQRAELAAQVAKRLEPQRKGNGAEKNPYIQPSDNTRVYNAQREIASIEYTVEPFDKEELKQLTRYIKSIKTKKELFLFAKSLHYKVDVISNRVETMIPKENQAEIAKLLEQKAKELGYAEPTRPNSISIDTFRNVFAKPIDKKVNYPKTNEKTLMETYEASKTKLLGSWDPVGEQIRIQEMEGTVGGVLDIATMILVTKGMGSMGAFVRIGNVGRNIGTATNVFKTANVASRFTKNAALINRLAKADKVLGGLWVNGAAGALHGSATMGAYGGLQGTVGMVDNTVKNWLEGKNLSDGLAERFEQTLVMGYENAKFGLFAGYSGVLAQALGKGTVALGSKGIDKLFKTKYSKTVLDKVSSVVTEEGISGSEFFTKMQAASKAEGLVGFGYETGFFTLYHKMEEAGVDFNNEESLLTYIQNNLDEETKKSLASTYVSEGGNLAMFKIIGSLIQWVHIGKLSSSAAMEIQAKNNRALRNMNMRKVVENGQETYLVKFNENDKPIKVAPEQLMQLCEQKMFYADIEDKVQKDGKFKLPNNQTVEYDKAKKVYRTVIDANNTVESATVEDLLNQVNQITFKNRIDEQLAKENQVELNDGIVLTKTDGKYQIEITLEDGKKIPVQSEDLNDVIMRAQFVKLVYDAESAREGQRTINREGDYPQSVSKDEDVFLDIAKSENPTTVAERRIFQQWVLDGLDEQAKPPMLSATKSTETSSLILTGKLKENLTSRYQEMGKVFEEIAQKRSADIKELVKQNPKNKQAVADGIVKILAQELGMEGFEPPIVFEVAEGNGFFDFMNGEIVIHRNITNVKDLTEVISHEFVHVLQFRDILAQYGEQGIKDIFNDRSIPENEKDAKIKAALNNDYNKRLLQSYNLQRAQSGTVNDYLRRIYKDEFTNTKSAITDMQGYTDQVVEREAYNLGSEHLGNRTEGLSELNVNEGLTLAERKAMMEAAQKREQKLASATSNSTTSDNVLNTNPASIISATEPQVTPYQAGLVNGHYFNQDASDFVKQMGDAGISMNTAKAVVSAVYSRFVGGEFGEPSKELKDFTISKLTNEFKDNPSEFTNFINSLHSCLDFRNPTSAEVVKRLFEVKAEGKLPEGTFEAFRVNNYFRNIDGRIFSNAKEIVDIIIDYPEYSQFLQKFASAHAHRTEYDTQSARKLCEVLKKLGMEKFYDFLIPYENHEIFMDLVNKVDIDKYPEEFRALLENTGSYNDFKWDANTTAEDINFVMELTRLARKKQPDEYSRWSFIENVCKIKTQEAKDFVIEYVKNSGSCYADTNITKALNEKPEIYPLVIKYMDEIYGNSPNNIYLLMELFKSNPSQETLDFFITSEPSLSRGRYEYGYLVLANAKDSEFLKFAIDNLAERDGSYQALDRAIRNFDVMNLDVLRYLLEARDSHGNFVFEYSDITRHGYKTRDGKPFRLDLDKIKSLAEQKYPDGKPVFDKVGDVTKVAIRYKEDAQALIDNEPPQKQLDAYTLYERTYKLMQDEVSKFGCKTFKEFEELIPTLQGKDRAEGGKLLGKIKKQTIDTFLSELPNDAIIYLSSGSGSFTAKDMDNAIQKMNNNPVLRKYLEDIEETGTIKIENNLEAKRYFEEQKELEKEDENDETELIPVPLSPASAVASFNQLEKALLSDDKTLVQTMKNSIIIDKSNAPKIKKDYLEIKSLYNILMKKYAERLSKEQLDAYGGDIEAYADANDYTFKPSVCIDALGDVAYDIGTGKVSALVHNEAPAKCMEYISQIRHLLAVTRDVPETKDNLFKIMKNPKLKDNDFKAVLSCLSGIINSGNKELFIATVDKLASKDKIDGKNIYKDVYSVIKQECGLNPEVTDTEIEGWSMDYLPYVLRAINTVSGQPGGELNVTWLRELIRTAGDRGKYEEFLFNPETENGKLNIESRTIFGNEKLNFDQFMNFKGKTEFDFHVVTLELEPIRKSITEDLINMKNEPSIKALFEDFAQKEELIFEPDGKIILKGKDITEQEDLLNFVTKINKFISDNSKIISKSPIADVKDHFSARKSQISRSITDGLNSGLMTISLWKRNVKHDLFQGHYCQCCVSMDGCNNHSIIQSLSHTVDQIAELKTADGTTVGKVKMLFLKDTKTGEPILLANGFEIISPYMNNDLIRDQFVNFMREYAKAVCEKEVPIYTGMTYQKINYEELPDVEGNFQLLGKTPDNTYHLDSYNYSDVPSSHPTELDKPHNMQLKILYKPKN